MTKDQVISIYGSHDASITFIDKNDNLRVYEYERFVKKRYAMFATKFDYRQDMGTSEADRRAFLSLIKKNLKNEDIQLILYAELDDSDKGLLLEYFPNVAFEIVGHHHAHACSGFYPSGYSNAWIFSVDGGGWDNGYINTTKIFQAENGMLTNTGASPMDLGTPYAGIGYLVSEVTPSPENQDSVHALSYAGKLMGLCAYGTINPEWVGAMHEYYAGNLRLEGLCARLNLPYGYNALSGQDSYDLAAVSQYVFEVRLWTLIKAYLETKLQNVVMVGGCGLNVLFNQKLKDILAEKGLEAYVPPNPNDCGLSHGMFLFKFPELANQEVCYSGIEILDLDRASELLAPYQTEPFTYSRIVELLKEGKILGLINDLSEVGPRALGNRSIICDPSFPDMKDTLNAKVKFREWFRPFAPVCSIYDASEYFNFVYESKYMSYAPRVKEEYQKSLSTITHVDNTARLQTVSEKDHTHFFNILSELKNNGHIPVILNTSFNIKGRPILTTIEDALYVLDNTELDYVVTNNVIVSKKQI